VIFNIFDVRGSSELEIDRRRRATRPEEMAMGARSFPPCLLLGLLTCGFAASTARGVTQPPNPRPFKIGVSVEEEREDQFQESVRKLRTQEEKLAQFLEQLRSQGVDMEDPQVFL